jgi:Domain of unknown function (DUF4214)
MRFMTWPRVLMVLALTLAALVQAARVHGGTLHVSLGGADSPTCGTPDAPCRNVDYAVNRAQPDDVVMVAGGTYHFANVANGCGALLIKSVVCVVNKSLTIRGGFAASSWAFDPIANPTVIDGQNTVRGVFVHSSRTPSARLTMANLTIQNGRAQGPEAADDPSAFGGGMSVESAAITLDSVTFRNNQALGANTGSDPAGAGGGAALAIRSLPGGPISLLNNVHFESNHSLGGQGPVRGGYAFGALFVFGSIVHVENSSFVSNRATGGGTTGSGALGGARADALGGAVAVEGSGTVSLTRVSASGNQVTGGAGTQFGGGAFGGAVFVEDATATIGDSLFQSNVAQAAASGQGGFAGGGGIMFFNSNGAIERTQILANRVTGGDSSAGQSAGTGGGGGLYLWRASPGVALAPLSVRNTVIADNVVQLGRGVNPGGGGGGLQVQGLAADLAHVTFARNQLGGGLVVGQAMVVLDAPGVSSATVALRHAVVANHLAATSGATALVVLPNNTLDITGGALAGNTSDTNSNGIPLPPGTITGLGTMRAVASADFVAPGPPGHDYHIASTSPLRDAATGSSRQIDMDGQTSALDGMPDIGADEYVAGTCAPGGATDTDGDNIPDAVEQDEGTHPCVKDNDVFGSARLFAMQQYRDFLDREGEIDGLLAWTGRLGGGTSRAAVAKAFFDSPEFQGSGAPIARLYFAYFDRIPDRPGLEAWIAQYKGGMSLATISGFFAASPEFQARYGALTNQAFVTLVYRNVLGRDPDAPGLAHWTNHLNAGTMTRGEVMLGFSESPEYRLTSYNRVFVTMIYHGMLQRMPEPAGFQHWVAQLNAGASGLDLVSGFLGAVEYRGRFLP